MTLHPVPLSPVLMAASAATPAAAPDWVHLLPVNQGQIETDDARGPYSVIDVQSVIDASFAGADRLPIDQDHATDLAAPNGLPAPARGWIVEMQSREDGVWGRVEWTSEGAALVADRAYRGISPVITHTKGKRITAILRASLVNRPNLKGLTALNAALNATEETPVDMMPKIAEALGLKADATADDIIAAIGEMMKKKPEADVAPPAAMQAATSAITSLQAQVADLTVALNARQQADLRTKAETFVDAAIGQKVAGLSAGTRDHFIALHMADPASTETTINALPKLGPTGMTVEPPAAAQDGQIALNAAQRDAARVLGMDADTYAKALAADKKKENA